MAFFKQELAIDLGTANTVIFKDVFIAVNIISRIILTILLIVIPLSGNAQTPREYDGTWNTPTISHCSNGYKYCFFGKAGYHDLKPGIDAATLPPIPGLKYRSCSVFCQKDTCFAKRAVLAIRCPETKSLLRWVSDRAAWFAEYCMTSDYDVIPSPTHPIGESSAQICNLFISEIQLGLRNSECKEVEEDHYVVNEQFGLLLTDCWKVGRYVTFYEAGWYDWMSCGDTTTESYYSVDVRTGKEALLEDIIDKDSFPKLANLMMEYLKNGGGKLWVDGIVLWDSSIAMDILDKRDGCALIREGLVIYFHPYTIGSGADGQFNAVIPYDRLFEMLISHF